MSKNQATERYLSYLLRHGLPKSGLSYNSAGFVQVEDVLKHVKTTITQLEEIVKSNSKKRFEFSSCKTLIRACQGHSFEVCLGLEKKPPPALLYHGTALENLESIFSKGLLKGSRHAVHLSEDKSTAFKVGARHSAEVRILEVRALELYEETGQEFELSSNGVWLIPFVAPKYLQLSL